MCYWHNLRLCSDKSFPFYFLYLSVHTSLLLHIDSWFCKYAATFTHKVRDLRFWYELAAYLANIINGWCAYKREIKELILHYKVVVVVVEWLACLPVTQKIGVRFYLERESSATSGWINVGREWCCQGCWSIEGGTPGGLFRTRGGLPRKGRHGRSQRPRV